MNAPDVDPLDGALREARRVGKVALFHPVAGMLLVPCSQSEDGEHHVPDAALDLLRRIDAMRPDAAPRSGS